MVQRSGRAHSHGSSLASFGSARGDETGHHRDGVSSESSANAAQYLEEHSADTGFAPGVIKGRALASGRIREGVRSGIISKIS